MTWPALLLLGIGLADLAFSLGRRPRLAAVGSAVVVVVVGLLGGVDGWAVLGLLAVAAVVLVWEESVTRGFARSQAWLPLTVLPVGLLGSLLLSGTAPPLAGPLGDLVAGSGLPSVAALEPTRAVLLVGLLLVQLSTGNVLVRLVLTATGTTNPLRGPHATVPSSLKGGRLLGPMERLLIVGLGLAGDLTAASIVVAAKGLLRFPELQATRGGGRGRGRGGAGGPGIHQVTEYFLVGSFVSWTTALAALALARA